MKNRKKSSEKKKKTKNKKEKNRHIKGKLTKDRIFVLVVILLLLPELYTQSCLAKSRSVRFELFVHSKGLNYQLGERISKKELKQKFSRAMQFLTDDPLENLTGIPWSEGYFVGTPWYEIDFVEERQGIQLIGIRGFPSPKFSTKRIVDMDLSGKDFEVYGIRDGMEFEKAEQQLFQYGFSYECIGYWKGDLKIQLFDDSDGTISSVEIKLYTPRQHRKIIKAYQELEGN